MSDDENIVTTKLDLKTIEKTILNSYRKVKNCKKLRKYYQQRYKLFSRFDSGILLDKESWYSVTPEKVAQHIAYKCFERFKFDPNLVVFDPFCGSGGNTIQFAKYFNQVYSFDIDYKKLLCAKQNSIIYNVDNKIEFICDDYFNIINYLDKFKPDIVFLSPPWGGIDYMNTDECDISKFPINGFNIFNYALKLTKNIVYFLPRNTNIEQILYLAHPNLAHSCVVEIEQNFLNYKLISITAYFGDLVNK
jgi:trimethylguanosine synthase